MKPVCNQLVEDVLFVTDPQEIDVPWELTIFWMSCSWLGAWQSRKNLAGWFTPGRRVHKNLHSDISTALRGGWHGRVNLEFQNSEMHPRSFHSQSYPPRWSCSKSLICLLTLMVYLLSEKYSRCGKSTLIPNNNGLWFQVWNLHTINVGLINFFFFKKKGIKWNHRTHIHKWNKRGNNRWRITKHIIQQQQKKEAQRERERKRDEAPTQKKPKQHKYVKRNWQKKKY